MIAAQTLIICSLAYMGLLFAIAYYGDRMARMGRSITSNPYIYALSMAVYCTAWTFYGSVGRAVAYGPSFLTEFHDRPESKESDNPSNSAIDQAF